MFETILLGRPSSILIDFVKREVSEASKTIGLDTSRIRVVIAETRDHLQEFLLEHLGEEASEALQPASAISHIYVSDKPTILVVASELYDKEQDVAKGELLIALAHAKLHGSEEYYVIEMPEILQSLASYGVRYDIVSAILYLVASASKGYEATNLLTEKGYVSVLEKMFKYYLEVKPEEKLAWMITSNNPEAQVLLALNTFKALANVLPVYRVSEDQELHEMFIENLELLPSDYRFVVEDTLFRVLVMEPQSTHERIRNCINSLSEIIFMILLE